MMKTIKYTMNKWKMCVDHKQKTDDYDDNNGDSI